ncbi:hypothetical protein GGR56DRAFT_65326 [Xylariaceae sp. FL0804]|nr:hypothetical protein GGR56DRAFT_65326 [Xylariaceae sp. FL0804]
MATIVDQEKLLDRAIDAADAPILRGVLKDMCRLSKECREQAELRLIVPVSSASVSVSSASKKRKPGDKTVEKAQKKQKGGNEGEAQTARFSKCETCKEVFDITLNHDKACQTHEDALEIDEECFPDDDDVAYHIESLDPYTDWRREEWPEGFIWQCCEENINGPCCVVQAHIPSKS